MGLGFEQDIRNLMFSFQAGVASESDFESLIEAESKRNAYSIKMSDLIRKEVENIYTLFDKIADCVGKKLKIPNEVNQGVFNYITKVMLIIKNFQKGLKSTTLTIGSSIIQSEDEIRANDEAMKKNVSLEELMALLLKLEEVRKK